MAAEVIWSSEALDDLDAIAQFIARDSPHHAQRVVEALFELGEVIAAHPRAGCVVPELGDVQVRERFLYSYRLIYEVRLERIEVLAVLHGRRLLESIGERFEG
ncbi:type II toxin-antitoxin system RelE/ParE family toxin [Metallibacterium sp.]|uniref:type II toxin-antitoxin system RelE/ParE family toxin n=2 Tax=Metallibacterium sp. TaxID=2940281 RepID=UPI0026226C76|nr:type II toxin-antitoxin system RelE/ParE family toxin [Metallibacterium sp.]